MPAVVYKLSRRVKRKLYDYMVNTLHYDVETARGVLSLIERIAKEEGINPGALVSDRENAIRAFTELYMLDSGKSFAVGYGLNTWSYRYGSKIFEKQRDPRYVVEKTLSILSKLDNIFIRGAEPVELNADKIIADVERLSQRLSPSVSTRTKVALVLWRKYRVKQSLLSDILRVSRVTMRKYKEVADEVLNVN